MRFSLLLVTLVLVGCNRSESPAPIDLGHIDAGTPDEAEFRALELAVADLNADAARRPLGRPVRLRHASGGTRPEEWGAQATRLVALNRVNGLLGGDRAERAQRIGAALDGENVIAVSPADWPNSSPSLFTVGVSPAERGRVLAKSVLVLKPPTVAIVRDPVAKSANLAADQFAAECKAAGVRVIDPEPAAAKSAAAVVFFAGPVRLALDGRPPVDRVSVFGGCDADLPAILAGGASADSLLVATAVPPDARSERLTTLAARYREKYGQPPPAAAALAHDCLTVWAEAVRRANTLDVGPVRDQFRKREQPFDCLTGPLDFADDHTARRPVFVGRVVNGTLTEVQSHEPAPVK